MFPTDGQEGKKVRDLLVSLSFSNFEDRIFAPLETAGRP